MDTLTISAEPIEGYFESCYAAFLRGDPRPQLSPEIEDALTPDARGRIDEVIERLRRQAEVRRGRRKRRGKPKPAAGPSPEERLRVPGYDITGLVGEGGFGRVYRAISRRHFGVPVALKILRPPSPSVSGPEAPDRRLLMSRLLIGEAQVLAHIGHRNVVRYLGSGIVKSGPEAGTPFVATELIDGQSLAERIGEAPQDPRWSARILAQVADALDFVHQLKLQRPSDGDEEDPSPGILHRDVKPSNIVLGRGNQPILTDFGLAGRVGRASSDDGFLAGTAGYSAPEQLRADAVLTPAVDVYGLGATLYHLLTGQPPQRDPAPADRAGAKDGPRLISPRRLASRIPADLERICVKCLEEDPSRRYQTAGAVRDDLHRFLDGKPVSIHPVGPWGRALRWARHRPLSAALAVSLVLTLSVGFLTVVLLWRHDSAERVRAEVARREAEQNLEMASSVIAPLERLVLEALQGAGPLEYDLAQTSKLLREQIVRVRTNRAFPPDLLLRLSQINWEVAARLWKSGRLDEARDLARERIDLMRQARVLKPGNEGYLWEMVHALLCLADLEAHPRRFETDPRRSDLETDPPRFELALDHLDQATALALGTASASPFRLEYASYFFDAYHRLQDRSARGGTPESSKRARDGKLKLLPLFGPTGPDRADQQLRLACALADHGEWVRARGFAESLASRKRPVPSEPIWLRQAVEQAQVEWFARETRNWGEKWQIQKGAPESLAREAVEIVILPQLAGALDIRDATSRRSIVGMTQVLSERAASQRRAGRLGEAVETVALLTEFASRLVTRYPNRAAAHWALSEAYMQIYKNACRTGVQADRERYLKLSMDAACHVLVLEPDNARTRLHLAVCRERLDNLLSPPKSVNAADPSARTGMGN